MFDIPHCLKALRNMLLKHEFVVNGKTISWKYIVKFYNSDKVLSIRVAPKLTDSHIFPSNFEKMKVKYASQIFSETVSAAMNVYIKFGGLPAEADATAEFVNKIDKLFDILNSSKILGAKKFNLPFRGLDYQVNFLNEMSQIFENLKVINSDGVDVTNSMKFIKGFQISINALFGLWDCLKSKNVTFLFTRRLNQDCLENFFGSIRQQNANCIYPMSIQFQQTFKKLFCIKLLNSGTENCENDTDNILLKISDLIKFSDIVSESGRTEILQPQNTFPVRFYKRILLDILQVTS